MDSKNNGRYKSFLLKKDIHSGLDKMVRNNGFRTFTELFIYLIENEEKIFDKK